MRLGIFYSRIRKDEKMIIAVAQSRNIEIDLLHDVDYIFALENRQALPDIVLERGIHHARALESLFLFEQWKVPTVNSFATAETCGNKFLVTEALLALDIPMPLSAIALNQKEALAVSEKIGYPVVYKPAIGSWGTLLAKANDRDAAEAILDHKVRLGSYHHGVVYVQKFIEHISVIRVFVVNYLAVDAVRITSDHWIASRGENIRYERQVVDDDLREIAQKSAQAVRGDVVAVDILQTKEGYQVIEVEYTVEFSKYGEAIDQQALVEKIIDVIEIQGGKK